MGHFHINLIYFRIVESGVDFDVAENALNLFYRHSFVYGHCGEGSAEFVWVNLVQSNAFAYCSETDFNSADCQSVVWAGQ